MQQLLVFLRQSQVRPRVFTRNAAFTVLIPASCAASCARKEQLAKKEQKKSEMLKKVVAGLRFDVNLQCFIISATV